MSKIGKISGFPEWLPEQKMIEDRIVRSIREIYEGYGFVPLETAAVELLSVLQSKGVVDKEIYALRRAKEQEGESTDLGLHFDLSVPLARYVSQNFGQLIFPFKRYQCQKVWRGDRPQKGRFREFYQFDIDVIAQDDLPISCDAEVLSAFVDALEKIALFEFEIHLSNRKLLLGFFESLGLDASQQDTARIIIDKILKIGEDGVRAELSKDLGLSAEKIEKVVQFSRMKFHPREIRTKLAELGISNEVFLKGVEEVTQLSELLEPRQRDSILINLSLARGLDYYTGVVFEVLLKKHPGFGSVGGGGRYENLCSQFVNRKFPGVGASIGLTRLLSFLFDQGLLPANQRSTAQVMVTVYSEEQRLECNRVAAELRGLGVNTEVYFKSPKIGKQIDSAAAKGIPFVLFVQPDGSIEVKDLRSKEQKRIESLQSFAQQVSK